MDARSPVEILGAIVDEVDGFRRTDRKSHLPEPLLREARQALEGLPGNRQSKILSDPAQLVGRTIEHVFDDGLKRGNLAIICTDASFLILDADGDEDDATIITLGKGYPGHSNIEDYVGPEDLLRLGLISKAQKDEIRKQELEKKISDAAATVARLDRNVRNAREELERLQANRES